MKKLILGSSSPRRQQILRQMHIPFTVRIPNIDESIVTTNGPLEKVSQLSLLKAQNIPFDDKNEVILCADTVVSFRDKIFEKPTNTKEAYEMIATLSGQFHDVYTGVTIRSPDCEEVFTVKTSVQFWPLTDEEIQWYIRTNEPYDKAGAYGVQGLAAMFIKQIIGDYYNVVGLPISHVIRKLRTFGIDVTK